MIRIEKYFWLILDLSNFLAVNSMWNDPLLTVCEEKPKTPLTSISDEVTRKKALELGRACYMFASVLMKPAGIQYHVDLAQNILCTAMQNDYLKNELYSHLIKLTSGTMPYCLQVCFFLWFEVTVHFHIGHCTDSLAFIRIPLNLMKDNNKGFLQDFNLQLVKSNNHMKQNFFF